MTTQTFTNQRHTANLNGKGTTNPNNNAVHLNCPRCGSPAHLTNTESMGRARGKLSLRCSNSACGCDFAGVLTLTGHVPGAVANFSVCGNAPKQQTPQQTQTDC
jgi:hypothetical protein